MEELKRIVRRIYGSNEKGCFEVTGDFADGHLAYSRLTKTDDGEWIIQNEEDEGTWIQVRNNGHLEMLHL